MKNLLRLNETTWINPNLISMVTVDKPDGTGRMSVYAQGAGAVLDEKFADLKLLRQVLALLKAANK